MILREDILAELEKELGDLLADAPANLSESALKSIQAESIGYAEHAGANPHEDAFAVKPILDQGEA